MLKLPFYIYLKYIFYCKKENMGKANDLILHEIVIEPKKSSQITELFPVQTGKCKRVLP